MTEIKNYKAWRRENGKWILMPFAGYNPLAAHRESTKKANAKRKAERHALKTKE